MQEVKIKIALILTFKIPGLVAFFNGNIYVPVPVSFLKGGGGWGQEGQGGVELPNILYVHNLPHSHWHILKSHRILISSEH